MPSSDYSYLSLDLPSVVSCISGINWWEVANNDSVIKDLPSRLSAITLVVLSYDTMFYIVIIGNKGYKRTAIYSTGA
jgi:hypothetical protein